MGGAGTRRADALPLAVGVECDSFFVTHFLSDDGARAWGVVVKPGLNRREAGLGPGGWILWSLGSCQTCVPPA